MFDLIQKQRAFFNSRQTFSFAFREEQLKKLYDAIQNNEEKIKEALFLDLRKPHSESVLSEISFVLGEIRFTLKNLKKWMVPQKVKTPWIVSPGKSLIISEPLGVVLILAPWNYPFQLIMSPLIGALAGGNCAILKPSEFSKHTSHIIAELVTKTFDSSFIAVVEGGVPETQALLSQKWDHIFFTGSKKVGKIVMMEAAKHLTPVTLELGGKSPCIVDHEMNWEVTAKRIVWGKFFNAGQTCVAPDYLYLPRSLKDEFIPKIIHWIKEFFGKDSLQSSDYARIINLKHFDHLKNLMQEGRLVYGGRSSSEKLFMEPTLIDHVTWNSTIMQEEIFGPLLPILIYDSLEEVIQQIKLRPKPLALYFFSKNKTNQEKMMNTISFGGGCMNDCLLHLSNPHLPFGGVGSSGFGTYHGKFSYENFTHKKSIFIKPFWLDWSFRYPPFTEKKWNWIRRFI